MPNSSRLIINVHCLDLLLYGVKLTNSPATGSIVAVTSKPSLLWAAPSQWLSITGLLIKVQSYECRNSPVGYFGLRNSHKPGKTFLLLCKSVNFLYNPPSLSFSSPSQASNFTYNLKVLSTFFFYPSQIFSQHIFWKSNPMIHLLLRGSKLAQ